MTRELFSRYLRRYLIAGLLVWLPIIATIFVIRFILNLMDATLLLLPVAVRPQSFGIHIPGLGLLLAVIVTLLTGTMVTNVFGRSLVRWWDELLNRIPFVRAVYGGVKSFSTTLLSNSGGSFKKVLLIEYPRHGIWTIAFQTAADVPVVSNALGVPQICVFVPTTPNPTSGFIMLVPRNQTIELSMSVDEAMKTIVTLGVVSPPSPTPTTPPSLAANP